MIQVGSIVGLMVMPGEDWKNAKLPEANAAQASTTTTKVAKETKSENTASHSSSHLQMLVLEEIFSIIKFFPKDNLFIFKVKLVLLQEYF